MFRIDGNKTIHVTRGDAISLAVSAKYDDGTTYEFGSGTYVRLGIFTAGDFSDLILQKTVVTESVVDKVYIDLDSEETKFGELINQPVTYWYEIQVFQNTDYVQTIIGYDTSGAKQFILYPEGTTDETEELPNQPAAS